MADQHGRSVRLTWSTRHSGSGAVEAIDIKCASVSHDPATASILLGRVDLATWQTVRRGIWTHLTWDEQGQGRLVGEIVGPIESALDGFRFVLKGVQPEG